MSGRLYLATITVRAPLLVEARKIGGEERTLDQSAAWEAATVLSFMVGDKVRQEIDEGGYSEAILGLAGSVTRLERLRVDQTVEPDYHAATRR